MFRSHSTFSNYQLQVYSFIVPLSYSKPHTETCTHSWVLHPQNMSFVDTIIAFSFKACMKQLRVDKFQGLPATSSGIFCFLFAI